MVAERKISRVIIVYGDRLTKFGFETLRKMFQAFGTEIEVINSEEKTHQEEVVEGVRKLLSG
jgi:putative resolvase